MPKLKAVPRLVPLNILDEEPSASRSTNAIRGIIPHYFQARQCPICLEKSQTLQLICQDCLEDPNQVAKKLSHWICIWDNRLRDLDQACRQCDVSYDKCRSLDCPKLYLRTEAKFDANQIQIAHEFLDDLEF